MASYRDNPSGVLVYTPPGRTFSFPKLLGVELAGTLLAGLIAAAVLLRAPLSVGRGALHGACLGLFTWYRRSQPRRDPLPVHQRARQEEPINSSAADRVRAVDRHGRRTRALVTPRPCRRGGNGCLRRGAPRRAARGRRPLPGPHPPVPAPRRGPRPAGTDRRLVARARRRGAPTFPSSSCRTAPWVPRGATRVSRPSWRRAASSSPACRTTASPGSTVRRRSIAPRCCDCGIARRSLVRARPPAADPGARAAARPVRVAALGHSSGGNTVIALGGARLDRAALLAYCRTEAAAGDRGCDYAAGLPTADETPPEAGASYRDPRVRAIVAFDPAAGPGYARSRSPRSPCRCWSSARRRTTSCPSLSTPSATPTTCRTRR